MCKDALQYAGWVEEGLRLYDQGVMFSTRSQEQRQLFQLTFLSAAFSLD
jgi:hypothetical protein